MESLVLLNTFGVDLVRVIIVLRMLVSNGFSTHVHVCLVGSLVDVATLCGFA